MTLWKAHMPPPYQSFEQICEGLAARPDVWGRIREEQLYIPLLPFLEHPYSSSPRATSTAWRRPAFHVGRPSEFSGGSWSSPCPDRCDGAGPATPCPGSRPASPSMTRSPPLWKPLRRTNAFRSEYGTGPSRPPGGGDAPKPIQRMRTCSTAPSPLAGMGDFCFSLARRNRAAASQLSRRDRVAHDNHPRFLPGRPDARLHRTRSIRAFASAKTEAIRATSRVVLRPHRDRGCSEASCRVARPHSGLLLCAQSDSSAGSAGPADPDPAHPLGTGRAARLANSRPLYNACPAI